jgi:hypothetical protein
MSDALNTLETTYFNIQTNLNMMLAACADQGERDQVMAKYVAARQNYWACINKAFHDDDPALQALVAQAGTANSALGDIADQLGDIAKVIGFLTDAVTAGAQIAGMVIG